MDDHRALRDLTIRQIEKYEEGTSVLQMQKVTMI